MKKIILQLVLLLAFAYAVDITPQMINTAKQQYGVTDAQVKQAAGVYLDENDMIPTMNVYRTAPKPEMVVFDSEQEEEPKEEVDTEEDDLLNPIVSAKFPSGLKQFGYDVFNQLALTFTPLTNVPVAGDYILGPGDELKIYLWGNIQQNFSVIVDSEGVIELPKVGRVTVVNLSLDKASRVIESEMSKHFANFTMDITMGQLKTIPVFVLGAVETPGKYNVGSLSTVLNVLYASGGPTKRGSLRRVRVIRNNKTVKWIDLYDLLVYGDKSSDILLKPGDTIFVPTVGDVAAIHGSVKNPAIYEIRNSTKLADLITMAGKYTRDTYINDINIIRKDLATGEFKLKTLSFPTWKDFLALSKQISIKDGDIVELMSLSTELKDWVEVKGEISQPGRYSLTKSKSLKQLVETAGGLTEMTYLDRVNIFRLNANNSYTVMGASLKDLGEKEFKLQQYDKVVIYSNEERNNKFTVSIGGEVNEPKDFVYYKGITVRDMLSLANGYSPYADTKNIQILRKYTKEDNKVFELNSVEAIDILATELAPFDEVYIRKSSNYDYYGSVALTGRVFYPGIYPLYKNETFTKLVQRAGGFRDDAFIGGIKYYRNLDDEVSKETEAHMDKTDVSSIKLVSELTDVNRLKVDFKELFEKSSDNGYVERYDVVLRAGDSIDVPLVPQEVRVIGGVYNAGSFLYVNDSNMGYYLDKAGNFRKDADQGEVYVVKANGTVHRSTDRGLHVNKGDTVVIPTRTFKEIDPLELILDWTQVIFNVATTWAVIFK